MRLGYELITGSYGSGIAFSQGVEKGSLAEVDNTTTTLVMLLYSLLLLQDGGFQKMLVFDRTRLSPLFWHFCSPVQLYIPPLIMLHM